MSKANTSQAKKVCAGIIAVLAFCLAPQLVLGDTTVITESRTSVVSPCGKLFDIDANAGGFTPAQRASIIQKRLDDALLASKLEMPPLVEVKWMNNNPIVSVSGFLIVTADGNSAERNRTTPEALARSWAEKIRLCLADLGAINRYISSLKKVPAIARTVLTDEKVGVALGGMLLPVVLNTPLDSESAALGQRVEATLSTDVPLQPHFDTYLPAGSVAVGEMVPRPAHYTHAGKDALGIKFMELRTPDGTRIPINGHILGDIGTWAFFKAVPSEAACSKADMAREGSGLPGTSLASSGRICGAWRGNTVEAGMGIPFGNLVLTRGSFVTVPQGEHLMLQLDAPTSIAVTTTTIL